MSQKIGLNFLGGENTNKLLVAIIIIIILGGIYAGSILKMKGYGVTPAEATSTIKIGCTYTSEGPYSEISLEIKKGLELWADHVNTYGISAGDKIYNVQLICNDTKNNPVITSTTYNDMVKKQHVNFLIGPVGNQLAQRAIDIAEVNHVPLILTFTDDDSIFIGKTYEYTFMTMSPISKQIQTLTTALKSIDPNITNIAIIHEKTQYPTEIYDRLKGVLSVSRNYTVVYDGSFNEGEDPTTLITTMVDNNVKPDVIIISTFDTQSLVKLIQAIKQQNIPSLKSVIIFSPEISIYEAEETLGTEMNGIIYISQWEANAPFNPFYAADLGLPWYGYMITEDFIKEYMAKYSEEPTYYSVLGYTAGLLLQAAIEKSGTIDPDTVASTLLNMHIMTFYGSIGFQGSSWYAGGYPGLQEAHEVLLVQFQVEGGNLIKTIVWPQAYSTGQILYPLP